MFYSQDRLRLVSYVLIIGYDTMELSYIMYTSSNTNKE